MDLKVVEICAGGGGQALGLEHAGFEHLAALEIDIHACETLRLNRPEWNVIKDDIHHFDGTPYRGRTDLLAGGVPCPPFSIAGKQLGSDDDRDLFPEALRLAAEIQPRAVMLENVPGFASEKFKNYRKALIEEFGQLGYKVDGCILNACDFGVPQLRPRFIMVALRKEDMQFFRWPEAEQRRWLVGDVLADLIGANGWKGAAAWKARANGIAPTVVGGSKKHGGPDLGPTRAKQQWAALGVDGLGIADEPPSKDLPKGASPKLTVRMVARIQGFPDAWQFAGRKTASYRQVGNAFPPPVAEAVGRSIIAAFKAAAEKSTERRRQRIVDRPEAAIR
ncbi:MAG TPA: DNA (cytosine-5-)-methyltransferase [Thermoanaerobaculia bacterium]|nr:DNA (cytosine-5-)-methyltransferase [Thermoanaerobaculia bacterium]